MAQLGDTFKQEREARDLSFDEIEAKTRIKRRFLEAIEAGDYGAFPSQVVARGLIRNYATFLGLDPAEVLALYDDHLAANGQGKRARSNDIQFMDLSMSVRPLFSWDLIIGVLIVTALLGGAGLFAINAYLPTVITPTPTKTPQAAGFRQDSAFVIPTPTLEPTPTPTPTNTPTPEFYTGVTLEVIIAERSWVQVFVDDVKEFEGVLESGERRSWTGERRVAIRAGNAGGVEVVVNGQSYGLMGGPGEVKDQVWEKVDDPGAATPAGGEGSDPFGPVETATPAPSP